VATACVSSAPANRQAAKEKPVKKKSATEMNDELRPEYDFRKLPRRGVRGKYAERYRAGTNLVLLEPDVAKVFSSEPAVNEALRLVIQLIKIPDGKKPSPANRSGNL